MQSVMWFATGGSLKMIVIEVKRSKNVKNLK